MPFQPATKTIGAARGLTQEQSMIWGAEGRCFGVENLGTAPEGALKPLLLVPPLLLGLVVHSGAMPLPPLLLL